MSTFPFAIYRIEGHSMEPTIKEGSFVLVWCWTRSFKVGDIIAFRYDNKVFIKRIKLKKEVAYEVAGDNQTDSLDSRSFGLINRDQIIGKLISA